MDQQAFQPQRRTPKQRTKNAAIGGPPCFRFIRHRDLVEIQTTNELPRDAHFRVGLAPQTRPVERPAKPDRSINKNVRLKMKRFALLGFLPILLMSSSLQAHQDTPLKIENGKITGLPEKYSPASFDIKKQSLSVAGKALVFPDVLRRVFTFDANPDLFASKPPKIEAHPYTYSFSASWYHEQVVGSLPPYMLITVTPPDAKIRFELLIDMDKLTLLEADILIEGIGTVPIDLDGVPDKIQAGAQGGAGQSAIAPELKSEGKAKTQ